MYYNFTIFIKFSHSSELVHKIYYYITLLRISLQRLVILYCRKLVYDAWRFFFTLLKMTCGVKYVILFQTSALCVTT